MTRKNHKGKPKSQYFFDILQFQCGCGKYFTKQQFMYYWRDNRMKKFIAVPRYVAEQIVPNDFMAIISIHGNNELEAKISIENGWATTLFSKFDDIDVEIEGYQVFTKYHAIAILEFVEGLANVLTKSGSYVNIEKIIINCEAGISRSVAVMVALEKIFNGIDVYNAYPLLNKKVYSTIIEIAYEKGLL